MKLALYLPNFRDKVTVEELGELTALAEDLDFDSVWTLDRIVVPEASDRAELQYSFGMMSEFPKALPVSSGGEWLQGWPLIPWLAAKTIEGADRDEHHRHAVPGTRRARRGDRHRGPALERQGQRRRRVRLDAGGVRRGERLAHLPQAAHARARDDRDHAGHLDERPVRVPRRVRRLRTLRVRGQAGAAAASADLLQRAQGPEALGEPHRQVRPGGMDRDPGHAGRTADSGGAPSNASSRSSGVPARSTTSRSAA